MNIKILTPEFVVFDGEVDSVLLPGNNGDFQILKSHAAIVSSLVHGKIKLYTNGIANENFAKFFTKENEKSSVFSYQINSGVVEFNNNKGIILCD